MKEGLNKSSPNIINSKLRIFIIKLFGDIDDSSIQQILNSGKQINLQAGDFLFHQGDDKGVMYIVLSGRLRAIKESNGNKKIIGDIGSGETVGELSFFTKEPRMASVLAIRKTVVLEFTQEKFYNLVAQNPQLTSSVIQLIIERSNRNTLEINKSTPPKNIAVIRLQADKDLSGLTNEMVSYLSEIKITLNVYKSIDRNRDSEEGLFDIIEQNEGINILICDEKNNEWTKQCLIYADLIIVATEFKEDTAIRQIESDFNLYVKSVLNKRIYLLLIHDENSPLPTSTSKWLNPRRVDLHLHIRRNNSSDLRRFCRIITNKAFGLVLGGGGAKGFAHIGVVKALLEKGIEIDFLGGTSAGAIYGIAMCFADFNFDKIQELNAEAVRGKLTSGDLAFPIISILKGKKFEAYLKNVYSDYELEDIWINTFCVSTNYSKAEVHVHYSGLLWKKLMASMAIPGIFPPVVIDKHLHVDGGVMDNLPIEPMYRYPVDTIFAVSLSDLEVMEVNYSKVPNSWELIFDKVFRRKKYRIPGIASLIINSLSVNSQQKQELTKGKVSHYLALELKGFGMLDEKKWEEIMKKGYEQTNLFLKSVNI